MRNAVSVKKSAQTTDREKRQYWSKTIKPIIYAHSPLGTKMYEYFFQVVLQCGTIDKWSALPGEGASLLFTLQHFISDTSI